VIVTLSQGSAAILAGTWSTATPSTCRLFATDVYSGLTSGQLQALTEADFAEPTFVGYNVAPLTAGGWVLSGGGPSLATHSTVTFTSVQAPATPQAVHGYLITRNSDGSAVGFEVFSHGPHLISRAGESVAFDPVISLD
jgi:hypothetical protein